MVCCCCPDAINALFCLYVQSGCSKGTVAGALTFFPPDPPLYKFDRLDKDGEVVPVEPEEEEDVPSPQKEKSPQNEVMEDRNMLGEEGVEEELLEVANQQTGKVEKPAAKKKKASAAQQLTERAKTLKQQAAKRWKVDERDAALQVSYRLMLDPRLSIPPTRGAVLEAKKLRNLKAKSYVATCICKVPPEMESPSTRTIIYSHGNATDVGAMYMLQSILCHSLQCNVVSYDYSGYGESGGFPMEENTYSDLETVYEYVKAHMCDGDGKKIVLYGQSVGSGPSCHVAAKNDQLGGLILHSPLTSGMRVLTPSRLLACLDIYPNINRIPQVRCKTFIMHGKLDQEVPFAHGLDLYNAIPAQYQTPPWWIPDRGHNDITEGPGKMAEYLRRLRTYLAQLDEE